jgi:hypothetical protein
VQKHSLVPYALQECLLNASVSLLACLACSLYLVSLTSWGRPSSGHLRGRRQRLLRLASSWKMHLCQSLYLPCHHLPLHPQKQGVQGPAPSQPHHHVHQTLLSAQVAMLPRHHDRASGLVLLLWHRAMQSVVKSLCHSERWHVSFHVIPYTSDLARHSQVVKNCALRSKPGREKL